MQLIDTHCHIHELVKDLTPVHATWFADGVHRTPEQVIAAAQAQGVAGMICIGTSLVDSQLAVSFAEQHQGIWATVAIHPHETSKHNLTEVKNALTPLLRVKPLESKIVGIGECGLDYYYGHSARSDQIAFLRTHLELALQFNLPLSFHVRGVSDDSTKDAFRDFWPIFDEYNAKKPLRGVLHSFTDTQENMREAIDRGLYIGVNGIATFAKSEEQRTMYRAIPTESLVLETDAPFLTPAPFRGKICEPKHVANTLVFLADLRGQSQEAIAKATSENAQQLFGIEAKDL
ncbi:MAG: TatD DNase family protein [Patescibacteria group bacterium]|nr:TatD family hydrolase [Candidatus Saccharibacteria bacterium]MDQ5963409.1 TatD DNase family protein [Patescibacteria group bacterium]